MEADEKRWIEYALDLCEAASRKGLKILLVRRQDENDGGDYVITNANDTEITAMSFAITGPGSLEDRDNDDE